MIQLEKPPTLFKDIDTPCILPTDTNHKQKHKRTQRLKASQNVSVQCFSARSQLVSVPVKKIWGLFTRNPSAFMPVFHYRRM